MTSYSNSQQDEAERRAGFAGWRRSDAFDRLVSEVLRVAVAGDENRQVPAMRRPRAATRRVHGGRAGVYVISVAARLAEMHPQTLRKYDREGLVRPSRTDGSRRLYSESDLDRLRVIRRLSDELGLNLSGVSLVLELVRHLTDVMRLLESSEEVRDTRTARVAAEEIRSLLSFVGAGV